jgi:glycosyltransferase involved in cell wall biosynthesis
MFPQFSETFVANEVLELERLGVDLRLYSYRRPRSDVPHDCVRFIREPVTYLPDPITRHPGSMLRANLALLGLEPARYLRTFRWVLANTIKTRNPDTWRRLLQATYLAACIKSDAIEHLHAHFAHGATRVAMLASMLTGVPFSFTGHARDIYTAKPLYLKQKIDAAQYVVTCTGANQEYLRALVAPEDHAKVHLVYHGVDRTKFRPGTPDMESTKPLVLSVGRLVEKKGLPELLHACSVLRSRGCDFECLIVGEGPQRQALEERVRELELESVVSLPGARSQEDLLAIYRRATVFALPCKVLSNGDRDGIPNVLIEAMAVGVPIVATMVSGIPELIRSGENGLLVKEGDGDGLADALEALIRDPARRRQFAERGRSTVEKAFDLRTNAEALAELLRREVGARAG